nr:MAG TPA: hypothetical protein [Caudoviricetes sp.]
MGREHLKENRKNNTARAARMAVLFRYAAS